MIVCAVIYIYTFVYYINNDANDTPELVKGSAAGIDATYKFEAVIPDCVACLMMVIFCLSFRYYRKKMVTAIDLQQQTAQDYSVRVHNPPRDADNADEWHEFFKQFGDVVNITICKNNGSLLRALAEAKLVEQKLETAHVSHVDPYSFPLSLPCVLSLVQTMGFLLDEQYWIRRQLRGKQALKKLCRADNLILHYHVTTVFCTFDREEAQRTCLEQLAAGLLDTTSWGRCLRTICAPCCTKKTPFASPHTQQAPSNSLFQGQQLDLSEPEEPSEILWANLDYSLLSRVVEQALTWACAGLILLLAWQVQASLVGGKRRGEVSSENSTNEQVNGIFVALVNYLVVQVMVALSNSEHHKDEGNLQVRSWSHRLNVPPPPVPRPPTPPPPPPSPPSPPHHHSSFLHTRCF
jgi:hypothetical protein